MNTETGEIVHLSQDDLKELEESGTIKNMIPIDDNDMTPKQKKTKQVSKKDNRSDLGVLFMMNRKERRKQKALMRKSPHMRNK